ncbi:MAG: hypothetical protein U0R52_07085 [Solirubrobacterales bacterium]
MLSGAVAGITITFDAGNGSLGGDGQRAGLLLLAAFLLSFGFIRMSTRLMRSPKVPWWPGSVRPGGLHIHHLVFGIVLIILAGFLEFALQPDSPWAEILAVAFGVGCGLTLDEFALWLHLEDVYWSEEGRRSIDATIVAAIIGGAVVLGFAPLGGSAENQASSIAVVVASVSLNLALCIVTLFKGKLWTGLVGFFVPLISLIGAIRVAQPGSPWARRFYDRDGRKMQTARRRADRVHERYRRWQDRIGGAPHLPSPARPPGGKRPGPGGEGEAGEDPARAAGAGADRAAPGPGGG